MTPTTTRSGSAARWGPLWGHRARDWAAYEEQQLPTFREAIRRVGLRPGRRVLESCRGAGVFLGLVADRGLAPSGSTPPRRCSSWRSNACPMPTSARARCSRCPTSYPDAETAGRLLVAPAGIARLLGPQREAAVRAKIVEALGPLRDSHGSYRLRNEFHYLVATAA